MNLRTLHLVSAYVLWCLGAYALWLGEWEDVFPFPIVVVAAAILAFFLTDRMRKIELSPFLSNMIGIIILIKIVFDLMRKDVEALTALAHFLVYLQVTKFFRVKKSSDFGQLYIVNILLVAIGAILAKQSKFGLIVATYFFLAIWCGMLFFLARHLHQLDEPSDDRPLLDATVNRQTIWMTLRRSGIVWSLGLPIALLLFWVLPRTEVNADLTTGSSMNVQWTGFSNVVTLDNETNIFESSEIAFTVLSAKDAEGEDIELPDDILWRGAVHTRYDRGEWKRERASSTYSRPLPLPQQNQPGHWYIGIDRVANTEKVLFTPIGITGGGTERSGYSVRYFPVDERIVVDADLGASQNPGRFSYQIAVDPNRLKSKLSGTEVPPDRYIEATSAKPGNLGRVEELVAQLIEGLPPDDYQGKINRLKDYLTASGEFEYALAAPKTDANLDPIEDFLFVRKTGHCEYFASSLAVMLRFAGIPSRLVTGYSGVDLNRAGRYYQVRQLAAHAWVEAYLPDQQKWLTLDPTPTEARVSMAARQRSWWSIVEDVRDVFTRIWGYYIVNFNVSDQRRVVEGVGSLISTAVVTPFQQGMAIILPVWEQRRWLIVLVGIAMLGVLYLLLNLLVHVIRDIYTRRNSNKGIKRNLTIDVYEDWLAFLRRHGLRKRMGQTPREFAESVRDALNQREETRGWAGLAIDFVDSWYAARFGEQDVPKERWDDLESRLQDITRQFPVSRRFAFVRMRSRQT